MPIQATVFVPPNGRQETIMVQEINDDDANWFIGHNVKLSMEQLQTGVFVLYADYGAKTEDGDPDEIIVLGTKGCREMMTELRIKTQKAKGL